MFGDEIRHLLQARIQVVRFSRLHQAEVPLGQGDAWGTWQRPDDRDTQCLDRLGCQPGMPRAAKPVEHDTGDGQARIVGCKALDDRRRGLRLAADVQHQQHRPAEDGCYVRR